MGNRVATIAVVGITTLFVAISFITSPHAVKADAPSIIINEIMYNPLSDIDGDEFLELHNTTGATIDISDWCFTEGITHCFNSGTTIAAGGYGVVSPDATQTQTTYGVTTIGTYTGKLSNGGETITLTDNNTNVINTLEYDDASPWPTTPDGTGPSLELNNPTLDNTQASSWSASLLNNGTPGQENSGVNIDLPVVTNVNHPEDVTVATTPTITANVTNATSINLVYKVMFNADQTLPMYDDGAHYDGAANDGVYGAMIPAQVEGQLVRYKVSATNTDGTVSNPGNDDTINYYGYTIQKAIDTQLPVLQWFISDSDYADLIDDPSGADETYFDCVIVFGNQVFDASRVRLKGEYTRTFYKSSFKVKLPKGHSLSVEGVTKSPINEFHLNSDIASNNYVISLLAWRVFEQAGFPVPARTKANIQRNGQFEGAYTLIEKYDKGWESDYPQFGSGEIYEDFSEKKQPLPIVLVQSDFSYPVRRAFSEFHEGMLVHGHQNLAPVTLVDYLPHDETDLVARMLYSTGLTTDGCSMTVLANTIRGWSESDKIQVMKMYFGNRHNRRIKPGRAIEKAHFEWELIGDYGTFRDLQRHRMVDAMEWQPLTPFYGYDVPDLIKEAGLAQKFKTCMNLSGNLYRYMLNGGFVYEAQYAVCMGYKMRYSFITNLRELFHLLELRTSPQGHPGYRKLCNLMYEELARVYPVSAAAMLFVNRSDNLEELTRMSSERGTAKKLQDLGIEIQD